MTSNKSLDATRGARLAFARRIFGVARGMDYHPALWARLLRTTKPSVARWETGAARPRDDLLVAIEQLCAWAGIPYITAQWIDYGGEKTIPEIITGPIDNVALEKWDAGTRERERLRDPIPPMPANAPPLPWLNPDKDSQESPYRILKFEGGMARVVPSFSTTGATGPAQPEPAKVEPPLLVAAGGI